MSLQRQYFLFSYSKTLSVGPAGFEPATSRSANRRSPNRANQAAVKMVSGQWSLLKNLLTEDQEQNITVTLMTQKVKSHQQFT